MVEAWRALYSRTGSSTATSPHLPPGGLALSLSMRRTLSRNSRNSAALAPTTLRAMIEDEAWPSAQAFT
jgi:hypothetical protein